LIMKYHYNMKYFFVFCSLFFVLSSSAQTKKIICIADRTVACAQGDCMQVKEKKKDAWKTLTDTIIGLTYEEGYEYKVKVIISSSNNYSLEKIISKKKTKYNPAVKLEGRKWVLKSMFDNDNTMRLGDTIVYLNIDVTKSRVTGHGVCNNLKGELKAEGKNISFSGIGFTKMKCVDQGNIMEKIVTNLLEATNTYQLKGNQLILYSAKGSYMVFVGQ